MRQQPARSVDSKPRRDGLCPGEPAPGFVLPALAGGTLSLADFEGARVLLVFSDPNCGPCELLAPRLQRLAERVRDVKVVMISRGTSERNLEKAQEHGLTF